MNESSLWAYIKHGMLGHWHATRIESSAGNGVPDVSYAVKGRHGWIELKYIKEWPKRKETKLKLPLRPNQKLWIRARLFWAEHVYVICRVADDFFIFHSEDALHIAEGSDKQGWLDLAYKHWHKNVDFEELRTLL